MPPVPGREDSQPPQEGFGSLTSQTPAPTTGAPDPQDILKQKLNMFRSADELISTISTASNVGSKYGATIKNLLKQWMMDEVRNTKERKPPENPNIPGAS